ncbi:MAG: DNA-binding protein WhiA [Lachnospiraceae bacterium]|nr:DNA-binding protein WhiA [Lachnospiraceae bacterium]
MSFSGDVKEELVKLENDARHCQIAELAAIFGYSGAIRTDETGAYVIEIQSDAPFVAVRCQMLLQKLFRFDQSLSDEQGQNILHLDKTDSDVIKKILQTIKYKEDNLVNPLVIKSLCCKRAYLRGAFLSIGSMSNPEKGYHLEFVCGDTQQAGQLMDILMFCNIRAKVVARKKYQVVYIKESEEIVELLNVIGAHISLMNLENLRILKDMRNSINRRVNCEAANITKTVNAATKQIDDIQYIKEHYGFDNLADNLRQMAELRLEYPDATLKELGEHLTPTVGKSGVNHRLRKLSELAEKLKTGG